MKTHIYLCDYFDEHSKHDGRGHAYCGKILTIDKFSGENPICKPCDKRDRAFRNAINKLRSK